MPLRARPSNHSKVEREGLTDPDQALCASHESGRPWRTLRRIQTTAGLLVLFCLPMSAAHADIWGYIDSERMPHFASSRIDDRYEIFLHDTEPAEQSQPSSLSSQASDTSIENEETSLQSTTEMRTVSPKLLAFFERSKNYKTISPLLLEASQAHGIDYSLLKAVITTESGFNPNAVSPKGAVGLMQLIPPTAQRYGVTAGKDATIAKKLTDPKINIRAGARYLADLIKMFPGQLELALAAYNAGEGAVQRAGNKIPNYPETQNYVKTVMQLYNDLAPAPLKAATGRIRMEIRAAGISRGNTPSLTEPAVSLSRGE